MPYCPTHDYEWSWGQPSCPGCDIRLSHTLSFSEVMRTSKRKPAPTNGRSWRITQGKRNKLAVV